MVIIIYLIMQIIQCLRVIMSYGSNKVAYYKKCQAI